MSGLDQRWEPRLEPVARDRLDTLVRKVRADPAAISTLFPAVGRLVARGPAESHDAAGVTRPRLEDQARVVLVAAVAEEWKDRPDLLERELADLYRYGDADEKRAILQALSVLDPDPRPGLLPLVDDALRTNDVRLVAAALGDYGARHLSADTWRQGVLKCLFVGVPLAVVARLDERADAELARMVADYCDERAAAGRPLPPDARRVLDRFPQTGRDQQEA